MRPPEKRVGEKQHAGTDFGACRDIQAQWRFQKELREADRRFPLFALNQRCTWTLDVLEWLDRRHRFRRRCVASQLSKVGKSMFALYDVVILKRKLPEIPVPAGSQGTIVHVHDADPLKYLVEFPDAVDAYGRDANGQDTLGVYPVDAADLEDGDNS
jgi:Domain of unknown function (DUF4926)